jgi:restriction system protein
MSDLPLAEFREQLDQLRQFRGRQVERYAHKILRNILFPVLAHEGFTTVETSRRTASSSIDYVAYHPGSDDTTPLTLGVEYKHFSGAVGLDQVHRLLGVSLLQPFDRILLLTNSRFTHAALAAARQVEPISVELLTLDDLERLVERITPHTPEPGERVSLLLRTVSHEFARLVAQNPRALDHLEWRDLERMVARVMAGLGFEVVLTPGSKDGGKDLILTCEAREGNTTYIVELKHWRSGVRVGKSAVSDFLKVIVKEKRAGGVFLSTSGFSADAFEGLTEVERQTLRFGGSSKIVALARTYVRAEYGLWSPPTALADVLFKSTE